MSILVYLLVALFAMNIANNANERIDFEPKQLKKEIIGRFGCKEFVLNEMVMNMHHAQQGQNGKFFSVTGACGQLAYVYTGRVKSCRTNGCALNTSNSQNENFEYFDYYMLFDHSKTVLSVKIFNYAASHGHEITAKAWLKQFIGFNASKKLEVGKEVDAISGATISVYGITTDIETKTKILNAVY